ncbi:MAG: hypothetical protein GY856_02465 [bacterium]|nr:hypothetical protein [bacterium]
MAEERGTFREDYPECEALLVYRGAQRLRIDGIWCLPGEEFLRIGQGSNDYQLCSLRNAGSESESW